MYLYCFDVVKKKIRLEEQFGMYDKTCSNPGVIAQFFRGIYPPDIDKEVFLVFLLGVRNDIRGFVEVGRGGVDNCPVDMREVFRAALIAGVSSIILAHNHPSGFSMPSTVDLDLTDRVVRAGKILGVLVLDHVVVAKDSHYSMTDNRVMCPNF